MLKIEYSRKTPEKYDIDVSTVYCVLQMSYIRYYVRRIKLNVILLLSNLH